MKLPAPTDIILVAVLPKPRDLDLARLFGWYRIPLRSAPKLLMVDYVAFYQPGSFGESGKQIEYVARVHGHELTTRADLLRSEGDHPNAHEEYFKLQIGGLLRLPRPVRAKNWKRFVFFYTTGSYLSRAETVDDLVVVQEDRPIVWQALRERASSGDRYKPAEWPELPDLSNLLELLLFPISSS